MISTQEFKEKFKDFFLKGKKGAEIGTIKNFMINGKSVPYIKTATGWKPYGTGKKMKKPEPEHEPREKKPEEIHEPREKKEEVEEAIRKKLQEYTSKATDNQLNAAINDPNQKEEIKNFAKKELEKRQKNGSGGIKQITQTYVKVSDGQIIVKMNKDKTGYKGTKGSFKLESKEGESISDFKQRLKEEYEKFSAGQEQSEEKVVSLQQENKEDMKTGIKIEDFGDSTKELYEKTKENNSHLYTFVNKLIDSDFPKKDIFNFIKKEFDLGKVSSDFYADILGIKEDNKTSDKPKEIKQITQTYLKVSDGQFIIKMNKDKTGYKATKGSFKLESKEGEDITDFKKRLKEEYEKSQQGNSQAETQEREYRKFDSTLDYVNYQRERASILNEYESYISQERIDQLLSKSPDSDMSLEIEEYVNDFKEDKVSAENVLEMYGDLPVEDRVYMNQKLIHEGLLPIVNGTIYSTYNGEDYIHFDMNGDELDKAMDFYANEGEKNFRNATEDQLRALGEYMGSTYEAIRDYNYGKDLSESFWTISEIKEFNNSIAQFVDQNRIEDNLVLNRRMDLRESDLNNENMNKWIQAEVGDVLEDKSFSSFSLKQINDFGKSIQVTLLAKKGQAIANINNDIDEYEYLIQKGSKFKVIDRGLNSIVVELVD